MKQWESGYWAVTEQTAQRAVGGNIYLHKKQSTDSFWGGQILGYRLQDGGEYAGRIIFRFLPSPQHKGAAPGAGPNGGPENKWNWEKMICSNDEGMDIHLIHKTEEGENPGILVSLDERDDDYSEERC